MKKVFVTALVLSCLFVAAQAAQAQGGGKAEPGRISFKQGTHSSTIKGRLKGDEQAEYVFGAGSGQAVTIEITSVPANVIDVEVRTPGGESFALQSEGTKWTGTLPEAGDYFMVVKIAPGCGPNRASYILKLSIE
jgi:opacity protein-like surface antigen